MNADNRMIRFPSGTWHLLAVIVTTFLAIAVSVYYLSSGRFIVFQNLFYFPIIIACIYYLRKGFAFFVLLAFLYLFLVVAHTADSTLISETLIRVVIFIFIAGVVTFISLRHRKAEEALRQSEKKYRTMIENTGDLIYIADRKGYLTYINPMFERTLGYGDGELFGKSFADIAAPECIERLKDLFKRAMRGETILVYEADMVRKDGTRLSVEFNVTTLYDSEDKPAGRHGIGRDTTGRKQAEEALRHAEEKYRSIFENAQEGIYQSTPEGQFITANHAMANIFGYDSPEELILTITDIQHQLYVNPEDRTTLRRMVEDTGSVKRFETQFYRKDGRRIWISQSMQAVRDADGRILYYQGINEDITERKEAEEKLLRTLSELQEARDMLVQSEKLAAVGKLSTGVAHEILNPTNIISMKLQLIEMTEALSDKAKSSLQVCKDQVARITKITKDLNQFARVSAKQIVTGDLNQLIGDMVTLVDPRVKLENVRTTIQCQPDLPLLQMDKDRMGQVILNLISNALDAMSDKEEKTLHISTEVKDENVGLVISDTGTGINPEILNKIFDPFFTTKEPGKGTGLGLSISYGIIQDHAGKIWAENNEWGGASFFIELPIKHDTEKK